MYDLDVGPKPMDVRPRPCPAVLPDSARAGVGTVPGAGGASDALFPGEWTFDSDQEYNTLSDGSQQACHA
jgi:hypothetical protein